MVFECANQDLLIDWLCKRVMLAPTSQIRALGRVNSSGQLIGVVGYDCWTGTACEMHMAGEPGWLNREFLWGAFDYPFNQAGCNMVLARVPSGNHRALSIDRRLGFRTEYILKGAHPDGALHILSMRKDECKWLEKYNGQEQKRTAATA